MLVNTEGVSQLADMHTSVAIQKIYSLLFLIQRKWHKRSGQGNSN